MKNRELTYRSKVEYKEYSDIIIPEIIDLIAKKFGQNTSQSKMAWYAIMREIFANNIRIPKILEYRPRNKYSLITAEEISLSLRVLLKYDMRFEYIIIKLMGEYNLGPNDLMPNRTIGVPPKVSDLYIKNNNAYLDLRIKGGGRNQIKLRQDMVNELKDYIKSQDKYRGEDSWLFCMGQSIGCNGERTKHPVTYPTFWARFKRIKSILYINGCIPKSKKIVPLSFKGALNRKDGSFNLANLERAI